MTKQKAAAIGASLSDVKATYSCCFLFISAGYSARFLETSFRVALASERISDQGSEGSVSL